MMIKKFSKFCNKYNRAYKITIRSRCKHIKRIYYEAINRKYKFCLTLYDIENQNETPEEGYQYLTRISDAHDNESMPLRWYRYRISTKFSKYRS